MKAIEPCSVRDVSRGTLHVVRGKGDALSPLMHCVPWYVARVAGGYLIGRFPLTGRNQAIWTTITNMVNNILTKVRLREFESNTIYIRVKLIEHVGHV